MRTADEVDELLRARAEIDEQLRRHKNTLTVLFTDLVGSTSYFERNGDTAGLVMLHRHDELAARAIQQHDGKVVKMIGDSAMAEFPNPAAAVRAAIEIERQFQQLNLTLPIEQRADVRIGVHTGVGFRKGNDLFGDVVNVASRIVKGTAPAQILISQSMYEAIAGAPGLYCRWFDKLTLEGRTEQEDLYEVVWTDLGALPETQERLSASAPQIPARYEVLGQIGVGGTGIVYKVRDLETDEIVALKVLKPETAADPDGQENLKRELLLARKISHRNVCRIHEFSRSHGLAYMSMEFVEGESVSTRLQRDGALPLNDALDITRQICAGLREAHAQGIVHRDLKPANIMVDRNGTAKIMDFGIARMIRNDGAMTGRIVGTPAYMAPEQAELKPVSSCTDIYALGLVIYEMFTGVAAFDGDTPVAVALKQIREYPKLPREIAPDLPRALESVVMKCLQKDPARRYQSVSELEMALLRATNPRYARNWEVAVDRQLFRAEREIRNFLYNAADGAQELLEREDWRALLRLREDPKAMLGVTGIVCALAVFLLVGAWKPRIINAQSVPVTGQTSGQAATIAATHLYSESRMAPLAISNQVETSSEVDLFRGHESPALKKKSPISGSSLVATSSSSSAPSGDAKSAKARATVPAPSNSHKTHAEAHSTQPLQSTATAAPAQNAFPAAAAQPEAKEAPPGTPQPDTSSAALIAQVVEEAKHSNRPLSTGDPSNTPKLFIEVGTFKDENWANNAVEKLTQLGFHAVTIHKGVLWSQSYHVQVGPYATQQEIAEARTSLVAQGFKAHPVN